jgi:hypothetical protein
MKWTRRTARRAPRAVARVAALAGMLAASGLAAGVASASGSHPTAATAAAVSLTYRCRFPSGSQPATVAVTASLPTVATTGKPIQPTGVTLTMTLPPAAVSALAGLHSATVSATTRLTVGASEGPRGISLVWLGTTKRPVLRPAHRSLNLITTGTVPSVTAMSPGEIALTAAGLSITFTAGKAATPAPGPAATTPPPAPPANGPIAGGPTAGSLTAGSPTAGGRAAVPTTGGTAQGPFQVTCNLAPGQHAELGAVLVTGKPRPGARHAAVTAGKCPPLPKGGLKFNPRFPLPPPIKAPGTQIIHFPEKGCAFTTGYADARKLKGAILLTPAFTNVELTVREIVNFNPSVNFAELDNVAQLDFHGLHEFPPSTATFLTFGFVPTTATVALVEHGTINILAIGPAIPNGCKPNKFQNCVTTATVLSRLSVNILPGTVKVNGVPLNVGTRCQTPAFDAIVVGLSSSNPPYSVQDGGPLTGQVTIPKFRNCGVGENLNPIFDAAISGPRNFNLLTQGVVCFVTGGLGCNKQGLPVPPTPLRKVSG